MWPFSGLSSFVKEVVWTGEFLWTRVKGRKQSNASLASQLVLVRAPKCVKSELARETVSNFCQRTLSSDCVPWGQTFQMSISEKRLPVRAKFPVPFLLFMWCKILS
jgi:hypothetical protein